MDTDNKNPEAAPPSSPPPTALNGTPATEKDFVVDAPRAEEKEKPWTKAGFATREDWRRSKIKEKAEAVAAKPQTEKPVKKTKAKKVKAKSASPKPKPKKAKKPKAKVQASGKDKSKKKLKTGDRKYKPQRTEPSDHQKKLLKAFGGVGQTRSLQYLGDKAWPSRTVEQRFSWARNNIRWLFANKFVSHVAPGEYKRLK